MGEAQADVKGAVFITKAEQSEDVHKVLVPPEHNVSYVNNHTYFYYYIEIKQELTHLVLQMYTQTHKVP